jgi:predicted DNA-binding antitoxin AbrB/MazE fold protein
VLCNKDELTALQIIYEARKSNFKVCWKVRKADKVMEQIINAVYENGTFRPLQKINMPEGYQVQLIIQSQAKEKDREIVRRMQQARDAMPPLGMNIKDLVEDGREL